MGKAASRVARMPEVRFAVLVAAERYAAICRGLGATHGSLGAIIQAEPLGAIDARVGFTHYDEKMRGDASSIEMGHINVPRGGRWTRGVHVLRDGIRLAEVAT